MTSRGKAKGLQAQRSDLAAAGGSAVESRLAMASAEVTYSSPLPPPELLAAYASVSPQAVDRLIAIIENQQSQRHERALLGMRADVRVTYIAQVTAAVVSIFALYIGARLIESGSWKAGGAALMVPLMAMLIPILCGAPTRR